MYEIIQKTNAYLASTHITGKNDSLGRKKPFFNICLAAVNIWYRATDKDRKNLRLVPKNSKQTALAFVANVLLKRWMDEAKFGTFLNKWGRTLARHGSAIPKFVEQGGKLIPSVSSWDRLVVDSVDFEALPTIEKFYFTPAKLRRKNGYDTKVVEELIEARLEARKTLEGKDEDDVDEFIEVYEVEGELPAPLLMTETQQPKADWTKYRQQMHAVAFIATSDNKKPFKDFTLFKGPQNKPTHMLTHLIEEEGRTLSVGAVEYLFDAQWMVNHSMKQMKDYLDLASKMLFQTSDSNFVGRNVLKSIETGDIFITKANQPVTQINNSAMNVGAILSYKQQWEALGQTVTSTPESTRGVTPASGVPLGTTQIVTEQGLSLFEVMSENKDLAIEEMLRTYIIPFIKKQMDTSEEIAAILDDEDITQLDAMYVPREAIKRHNKRFFDETMAGAIASPYEKDVMESQVKQDLATQGNQRFFKPSDIPTVTWKKLLDDFEWEVHIENNESEDKAVLLQTLNFIFQTIASNPMVLQDPTAKMIFGKIMNIAGGISPLQMSVSSKAPSSMAPMNPSAAGVMPNGGSGGGIPALTQ